jgi:hypothetical protein
MNRIDVLKHLFELNLAQTPEKEAHSPDDLKSNGLTFDENRTTVPRTDFRIVVIEEQYRI